MYGAAYHWFSQHQLIARVAGAHAGRVGVSTCMITINDEDHKLDELNELALDSVLE